MKKALLASFCGILIAAANVAVAQEETGKVSPKRALKELIEGNKRYVENRLEHGDASAERSAEDRRIATSSAQSPFAVILGCADSRVPPEIVFDQGIGDLFVVRVAGNVVGPVELDSVEFASLFLGSSVIMVLGHENCGAVKAVVDGNTKDIPTVASLIMPAVKQARREGEPILVHAIKDNVQYVVNKLKRNKVLANLIDQGDLMIVGGYYHLVSGKVHIITEKDMEEAE